MSKSAAARMEQAALKSARMSGPAVSVACIEGAFLMLFWNQDANEFHFKLGEHDLSRTHAAKMLAASEKRTGSPFRF
jgi:hypothetical protein